MKKRLILFILTVILCCGFCGCDKNSGLSENIDISDPLISNLYNGCFFIPWQRDREKYGGTFYQDKKVVADDLNSLYKSCCVHSSLIYGDNSFYLKFDYVNDLGTDEIPNVENEGAFTFIMPLDYFDSAYRKIFGQNEKPEHLSSFEPYDGFRYTLSGDNYEIKLFGGGDDEGYIVRIPSSAVKQGDNLYIYDYFTAMFYDNDEKTYFYADVDGTKLIAETNEYVEYPWSDKEQFHKTYGKYMREYKHIFSLSEDGTYYWLSSEPVK